MQAIGLADLTEEDLQLLTKHEAVPEYDPTWALTQVAENKAWMFRWDRGIMILNLEPETLNFYWLAGSWPPKEAKQLVFDLAEHLGVRKLTFSTWNLKLARLARRFGARIKHVAELDLGR